MRGSMRNRVGLAVLFVASVAVVLAIVGYVVDGSSPLYVIPPTLLGALVLATLDRPRP